MSGKTITISEAIGDALHTFRTRAELSLEQVADSARKVGATWGAASIRSIEQGEASLTLDRLLQLALTYRLLNKGDPIKLDDLLGNDNENQLFRLSGTAHSPKVTREWLTQVLSGEPVDPLRKGVRPPLQYQAAQFKARYPEVFNVPENISPDDLAFATPTGAEKRAAKNLPIDAKSVSLWAHELWGRSLDEEARRRAGVDATPQARGRVTRTLVEEIRGRLKTKAETTEALNRPVGNNG
jgi:hypothetical protein